MANELSTVNGFIVGEDDSYQKEALRFKSTSQQYVQITDSTQYDSLSRFTLNLWVRPLTDTTVFKQGIFVKEGVIETWVHNSPGNLMGMRANIGGVWYQAFTPTYITERWYMLTIKHDGSGVHFFMNGVEFSGTTAPGELTSNNNPIYLGRYPSLGTYSDIDMSDVQLWNYNLSDSEIAEMYQPQARRGCQHAYIHVNDETAITGLKRCCIISDASTTNPFTVTSSVALQIADTYAQGFQSAFITAGGETVTDFDTRFVTDNTSYSSWDNIIMVRGGQTRINELQLGSVVYPITREARRFVRIPTSYDPLVDTVNQDCWLQTHHDISGSRNAYIVTVDLARGFKPVFISGPFTPLTDSQNCYINNSELQSSHDAFVEGIMLLSYELEKYCFLNGFSESVSDSMAMFITGEDADTTSVGVYLSGPNHLTSIRNAFIMSVKTTQSSERKAFIRGGSNDTTDTNLYLFGHGVSVDGQPSYVVVIPTATDSQPCFIQAATSNIVRRNSFIRGRILATTSQPLYLKAEVNAVDSQPSYIAGINSRHWAIGLYVDGGGSTALSSSVACFIVNTNPVTSKFAFIVSDPQGTQPCYIVSEGSATRIKSAYIEGE